MSILEQQIVIGDKLISNDIRTDPEARSLTMKNGYYPNWKYPNDQSALTGASPLSNGTNGIENITDSKTAGQIG